MSLNSGERQVTNNIEEIRRDHVARYEWVAKQIKPKSRVIDFACGIGYGCKILADAGHFAHGFDIDAETIEYARDNFAQFTPDNYAAFEVANGNVPGELPSSDVAVSFETIEHIEDPRPLLKALRESANVLFASVPNESVMPWCREDGSTTAFHFRHYTKHEFAQLLNECGWHVDEWHGQEGPESEVEQDINGRTLIAVCSHAEVKEIEPAGKHIAILGLGPSVDEYLNITKRQGGRSKFCDETWAINALGNVFACDLVFHMDDIRIQQIRAEAAPASNIAAMVEWIRTSPVPVVTSRAHPDFPALVEFPLEDVLNHLGHDYFNNTAAYAVAFAIHTGAAEISLFGMDYTYPNVHDAEKGRACVEFWLGQAHARGIKIHLPKSTTLMDSCYPQASRLYGYDTLDIKFNIHDDGQLKLDCVPRETLPTAAEIEANYDHSAPIAKQHLGTK
jgi:SAM-dependent methyltransferase